MHGLGESRADTHLNARHGSREPNNRVGAAHDDGAAEARYRQRGEIDEPLILTPVLIAFWIAQDQYAAGGQDTASL